MNMVGAVEKFAAANPGKRLVAEDVEEGLWIMLILGQEGVTLFESGEPASVGE